MRTSQRAVAVAILSFSVAVAPVAAQERMSPGFSVPVSSTVSRYLQAEGNVAPAATKSVAPKQARAQQQSNPGGGGLGTGAKVGIWLGAIAIGSVWAYKTFSVTRGTD
jgi:hypothetical protein